MDTSPIVDMDISSIVNEMTPQPSIVCSPATALVIRVLTLAFLLPSVVVTANSNLPGRLHDLYASKYRHMLAIEIVGIVATFLQIAFAICFVCTGNRLRCRGLRLLQFFGDKALSYLLATGLPAAVALTDFAPRMDDPNSMRLEVEFSNSVTTAAGLLFMGSGLSLFSSVLSAFSLPKKS